MAFIVKIKKYCREFLTLSFTISSIFYFLFGRCLFYEVLFFFVLNIFIEELLMSVWRPRLLNKSFPYFLVGFTCSFLTVLIYPPLLWQRIVLMTCLEIIILSVLLIPLGLKLLPPEWKQNCLLSRQQTKSNMATDNYSSNRIKQPINRRELSRNASTHTTIGGHSSLQVPGEINPVSTSPSDETRSLPEPRSAIEQLAIPEPGTSRDSEANRTSTRGPSGILNWEPRSEIEQLAVLEPDSSRDSEANRTSTRGPSGISTWGPSGDSPTSETLTQEHNAGNKNTPASGGDTVQISSELNMPPATVENEIIPASSQTLSPPVVIDAVDNSSAEDDWTLIEQKTRSGAVYSCLLWNQKLKVSKPVDRKKK